jgi:hypothetical protein
MRSRFTSIASAAASRKECAVTNGDSMDAPIIELVKTVAAETAFAADGVQRLDAQATNSAAARSLYQARVPIHPKLVHGDFRRLKWIGMAIMLAIYYGVPWLRWERAGGAADQAVLVDLARERFYFFWIEIWPQEIYYLTGLLIIASLGLFLVTALFGRVWCGYACPQTVWTDLFIMVERLVEGDRNARIRLDKSAWTLAKVGRRSAKHAIWLLIAAATGGAWIFYFHDAPTLAHTFFTGAADPSASSRLRRIGWPATCASRCAHICVPGHAFRPLSSTMTR